MSKVAKLLKIVLAKTKLSPFCIVLQDRFLPPPNICFPKRIVLFSYYLFPFCLDIEVLKGLLDFLIWKSFLNPVKASGKTEPF